MAAKQSEFIVAGSRSAGAARADRLDEEASVLLVEDAPLEPPPAAMDPAFALALMGSASDEAHTTTKQAGLLGRSVLMPHGRLVGDSSAAERISDGISTGCSRPRLDESRCMQMTPTEADNRKRG
ncbi:MAG TPA: hypothetical protein VG165_15280 [Solirubrobacteraceae bacterium]|jgi:choline dehydrogenase-like flavoprotein|nr:hypothetical protein [Solirubrobacteraceae bacterium]